MRNVRREDLSIIVSNATGLARADISEVIKETLKAIAGELGKGKCVQLRWFGTFEFRARAERSVKENQVGGANGELVVPRHYSVIFNPANELKMAVRKLKQVSATRGTYQGEERKKRKLQAAIPQIAIGGITSSSQ